MSKMAVNEFSKDKTQEHIRSVRGQGTIDQTAFLPTEGENSAAFVSTEKERFAHNKRANNRRKALKRMPTIPLTEEEIANLKSYDNKRQLIKKRKRAKNNAAEPSQDMLAFNIPVNYSIREKKNDVSKRPFIHYQKSACMKLSR